MKQRIAIVYDWIDKWGGVERVLLILHEMFPDAQFFTSYYDSVKASWAQEIKIRTTFIQKMPDFIKKNRRLSLPLYPYAFESLDFSEYDLVISVSSSFAKGIITKPSTMHICYLLTPTRYLWISPEKYSNKLTNTLGGKFINDLKKWDKIASSRPDYIISISETVKDRCKKFYDRSSDVIYPPFDEKNWSKYHKVAPLDHDYYLVVSRLEPYKNVELVVDAFATLPDQKLLVVGEGSQFNYLKNKASHNTRFVGQASDQELAQYYSFAKALIMPQVEDFGYVSLEAQYFGCPVIAYNKGGAIETVDHESGVFFDTQSIASLQNAVTKFDIISNKFREGLSKQSKAQLQRFGRVKFERQFQDFISEKLKKL